MKKTSLDSSGSGVCGRGALAPVEPGNRSGVSGRAGLKLVEVKRLHKVFAGRRERAAGPVQGTDTL